MPATTIPSTCDPRRPRIQPAWGCGPNLYLRSTLESPPLCRAVRVAGLRRRTAPIRRGRGGGRLASYDWTIVGGGPDGSCVVWRDRLASHAAVLTVAETSARERLPRRSRGRITAVPCPRVDSRSAMACQVLASRGDRRQPTRGRGDCAGQRHPSRA